MTLPADPRAKAEAMQDEILDLKRELEHLKAKTKELEDLYAKIEAERRAESTESGEPS